MSNVPINCSVTGSTIGERAVTVSVRQCLAYAAGTEDGNPRYLDDAREGGSVAPPMMGVSLDWALRDGLLAALALPPEESVRGVHATQDMAFHRLIRPGDELVTRGRIVQAEARPPGAYVVARYETALADGTPVLTVHYGMIFRGVAALGDGEAQSRPDPLPVSVPGGGPVWVAELPVSRQAPHVYSECAAIYNPIHTERAVALAAGLPDIILHGTLTLAYAAREIVDREAGGDPARLSRLACRFGAMAIPGEPVRVVLDGSREEIGGGVRFFQVMNARGEAAVRDGVAVLSPA